MGPVQPLRGWRRWLLVALVLQFGGLALREAAGDAPTVDEAFDVSSGLDLAVLHDARMVPEHGVLPRVLSALPVTIADPEVPRGDGFVEGDWFQNTEDWIVANDEDDDGRRLERLLLLARLVPIVLAIATGLGLFHLGRSLFGLDAGLLASGLWLTTPVVVGLGHLATIDLPFATAVVLVSSMLLRHLRAPTPRTAALVGAAVGVALVTRHLGLVLLLTSTITVAVVGPSDRLARAWRALASVVSAFAVVWIVHRVLAPGGGDDPRLASLIAATRDDGLVARLVLALPLPQEWAAGFAQLIRTSGPRPAYLLGQAWEGGRWWYFPAVTVLKVGAVVAAVLVAGLCTLRRAGGRNAALVACGVPAVAVAVALLAQPRNLGFRYAVPVFALVLVLASPVVSVLSKPRLRVAAGAVAMLQVASLWAATPHSLAWTPPPFGDGYRWATDSNIDYGQDLFRLRRWEHIEGAWVAVVAPRGLGRPQGSRELVGADPTEVLGWVAVGATALTAVHRDELGWLWRYCPVATIGGSILLYFFAEPPAALPTAPPTGSSRPSVPAAPCTGSTSTSSVEHSFPRLAAVAG